MLAYMWLKQIVFSLENHNILNGNQRKLLHKLTIKSLFTLISMCTTVIRTYVSMYVWYSSFLTWYSWVLNNEWIAFFLVYSIKTYMLISLLTSSRFLRFLMTSLLCTQVCIAIVSLCYCNFFNNFQYKCHTAKIYLILKPIKCQRWWNKKLFNKSYHEEIRYSNIP